MKRLAIVATHPIQYYAPLFREIAQRPSLDVTVFYASNFGQGQSTDKQFGRTFAWDIPLLGGYRHQYLKRLGSIKRANDPRHAVTDIAKHLTRERFDAVLIPGYATVVELQALWAATRRGIPIMMRPEGNDYATKHRSRWKTWVRRAFLERLYARVSIFLAIGRRSEEHFLAHGGDRAKLVFSPYCVDNTFFQTESHKYADKRAVKKELGLERFEHLFLFCGKLISKKDPLALAPLMAGLQDRADLGMVIVGEGNLRPQLEAELARLGVRSVVFAGFQNQTAIGKYYAVADALVLASRFGETWGLVVNEAMNFGLPAIISDQVGCANDLIEIGRTGYVFESGNAQDFLHCAERLLADWERGLDFKSAVLEKMARYSVKAAADGIVSAVTSLSDLAGKTPDNLDKVGANANIIS